MRSIMENFCKECGVAIKSNKIYCSSECYYKRKKPVKVCLGCGIEFNPTHKKTKYCCNACSVKFKDMLLRLIL